MEMKDRIKQIRIENKMSQEKFGKEVDLTKGTVSKFENGKAFPGRETIEKIADRFNVPIEYLYGNDQVENTTNDAKLEKFKEIMEWLDPLPKDKEDMALDQMLAIAKALSKHHNKIEK
ncbi:transcriptional regulator [Bacillus cereus]|nr:transcriptional regulator [Bacillus cereus]